MTSQCFVHQEALFQLAALSTAINTQQCAPENKTKSVQSQDEADSNGRRV